MEITRIPGADVLQIKLKGRMDAVWSDHVGAALAESIRDGSHSIAVDMAQVDYISSAGIRILVMYARQLKSIQGTFSVVNVSGTVKKVLDLAGLKNLMQSDEARKSVAVAPVADSSASGRFQIGETGAFAETFQLDPQATMQVTWPGNPDSWMAGTPNLGQYSKVEFPTGVVGIGLGAFGTGDTIEEPAFGEFIAAEGMAICQPADGTNKPDYMLLQGGLIPVVNVAYGMLGHGQFRSLIRFDKGHAAAGIAMSELAATCLSALKTETVAIVMLAETAALVGASLQRIPGMRENKAAADGIFSFPEARDCLNFTAESAHANSTCLVAGFAATKAGAARLRLLKPMVPNGSLLGHFHAAAFPYRPLRKGRVELSESAQWLFDSERVLGVLHLVNDWREVSGVGESRFLRGACWCSPLNY